MFTSSVPFDCFNLVRRCRIDEVCFTCLKHSCTCTRFRNLFDCYSVNARFVSPVIIIALKACVVSLFPFCTYIWAGSAWMVHDIIAILFKSCRADDTELCQTVDKWCPCLCQFDNQCVIIRCFNAVYTRCFRSVFVSYDKCSSLAKVVVFVNYTIVVCFNCCCIEVCSVLEFNALTKFESISKRVIGNFP